MVLHRLLEFSAHASEWYYGNTSNNPHNSSGISNENLFAADVTMKTSNFPTITLATSNREKDDKSSDRYWDYASSSVYDVAGNLSSLLTSSWSYFDAYNYPNEKGTLIPTKSVLIEGPVTNQTEPRRRSVISNMLPWNTARRDIAWLTLFRNNPYNSVKGRQIEPSSMSAVRDLISLVPTMSYDPEHTSNQPEMKISRSVNHFPEEKFWRKSPYSTSYDRNSSSFIKHSIHEEDYTESSIPDGDVNEIFRSKAKTDENKTYENNGEDDVTLANQNLYTYSSYYSPSETASHLAEGTIRALRDLALDEAVELQGALRFWSERWERPVLSWLEAGPTVWFSRVGYNHQDVGRKVSQIQAVLARRCASIGELQEQILTAGWSKGVAQWGCLGQGTTWAAVAGFENRDLPEMNDTISSNKKRYRSSEKSSKHPQFDCGSSFDIYHLDDNRCAVEASAPPNVSENIPGLTTRTSHEKACAPEKTPPLLNTRSRQDMTKIELEELPKATSTSSFVIDRHASSGEFESLRHVNQHAGIFVRKNDGGGIYVDDPGFLALWSVQTIDLVRRQLYRAGNGMVLIPCQDNWKVDNPEGEGELIVEASLDQKLPIWAGNTTHETASVLNVHNEPDPTFHFDNTQTHVTITDLPAMVDEVQELLDVMQDVINIQRRRRLQKLQAPSWLRYNWYIIAAICPPAVFFARNFNGRLILKLCMEGLKSFYRERLRDPIMAIANELLKGRENFSDNKARMEAIATLKKMILSWLDDTRPDVPVAERLRLSEAMDISLIEQKKEESLKAPFYELNNVVRMSFIEMQYMKKEMMNALYAMDEMMSANDINMNIAAVTPGLVLAYIASRVFRFCTHALLKLGKSREETYASFRNVLTDIERLLIMRDNPPRSYSTSSHTISNPSNVGTGYKVHSVLEKDDLGMLMVLIHECKSIMWKNKRRFSFSITRSVSEDLAELAGERGAVSVQQQLRIVERMCRSYSFLKVISTGYQFHFERFRHIETV